MSTRPPKQLTIVEATALVTAGEEEHEAFRHMLVWAYSKLHTCEFSKQEDALELDRLKIFVEYGILS